MNVEILEPIPAVSEDELEFEGDVFQRKLFEVESLGVGRLEQQGQHYADYLDEIFIRVAELERELAEKRQFLLSENRRINEHLQKMIERPDLKWLAISGGINVKKEVGHDPRDWN